VLLLAAAGSAYAPPVAGDAPLLDRHLPRPVDPSLQMSVVTVKRGNGPAAREGDVVQVRYDGKPPRQVAVGWDEGIVGMRVGETRRVRKAPRVATGEALSYEVELVAIRGGDDDE